MEGKKAWHDSVTVKGGDPVQVSSETAKAQRQWLRDGTVPASYVNQLIGRETEHLISSARLPSAASTDKP
jgi:hypothetical protein